MLVGGCEGRAGGRASPRPFGLLHRVPGTGEHVEWQTPIGGSGGRGFRLGSRIGADYPRAGWSDFNSCGVGEMGLLGTFSGQALLFTALGPNFQINLLFKKRLHGFIIV